MYNMRSYGNWVASSTIMFTQCRDVNLSMFNQALHHKGLWGVDALINIFFILALVGGG
jgi:hypothetical protein